MERYRLASRNLSLLLLLSLAACGGGGGGGGSDSGSSSSTRAYTVSTSSASVLEGNSGTTNVTFTVSLSAQANGDVTADYTTSDSSATGGASCTTGIDYETTSGTVTISAGTTSATVSVPVCGDTVPEATESFTLTLANVSANASLGTATANGAILNDDVTGVLNDTGITTCSIGNVNDLACNDSTAGTDQYPGQDAEYGRDADSSTNSDSDGHAGFSFVKIGSSGEALSIQNGTWSDSGSEAAGTKWSCVRDTVTGLEWEVKTNDSGLHDKGWTYTWYNSTGINDGGNAGTANGGSCSDSSNCDTEKFVAAVNAAGLCGHSDWRLPTAAELDTLVDNSVATPGPAIDTNWFPHTPDGNSAASGTFWTSSTYAYHTEYGWVANFGIGSSGIDYKTSAYYVRLVRGG